MAVIQYTGIVNQIRGKLNGSVFNKSRSVNTLQRKQQQSKGVRGNQSVVRGRFNDVQRSWKNLPPLAQQAWQLVAQNNPDRDRFGELVVLSGYNKYIQCRMNTLYNGSSISTPPPTDPANPLDVIASSVNSLSINPQPDGTVLAVANVTLTLAAPRSYGLGVAISMPISSGVTAYHGRFVSVGGLTVSGSLSGATVTDNIGGYYPEPQTGQKVIVRLQAVNPGNGVVIYTAFHELIF